MATIRNRPERLAEICLVRGYQTRTHVANTNLANTNLANNTIPHLKVAITDELH